MDRKWMLVAGMVLMSCGCNMCSDCCDYLPPVVNGPYPTCHGRAGSRSMAGPPMMVEPVDFTEPADFVEPTDFVEGLDDIAPEGS